MRDWSSRSRTLSVGGRRSEVGGRRSEVGGRGLSDMLLALCDLRGLRGLCDNAVGPFLPAGYQHRKGVAGAARADRDLDVGQAGIFEEPSQFVIVEAEPFVAEALADPLFLVPAH